MGRSDRCYFMGAIMTVHVLKATSNDLITWPKFIIYICMTKIAVLFWENKQI